LHDHAAEVKHRIADSFSADSERYWNGNVQHQPQMQSKKCERDKKNDEFFAKSRLPCS
jgi:phosphoribosylaminoimidazole-succinocarboxamide synthase